MERTEIGIGNMRIDVVGDNTVYININGYMGQLSKHEKLIGKIEKVLFN